MSAWANMYQWRDRAAVYDAWYESHMLKELEERRLQSRIETARIGERLRNLAGESLTKLRETLYEVVSWVNPATGKVEQYAVMKKTLAPQEIIKMAEVGVRLERLGVGLDDSFGQGGRGVQLSVGVSVNAPERDLRSEAREILEAQEKMAAATYKILHGGTIEVKDIEVDG